MLLSYRPLAWFWGGVAWVAVVGGSTLQLLGPPSRPSRAAFAEIPAALPPALSSIAEPGQSLAAVPPLPASAAVEAIVVPPLPPILSQPGRERPRTLVRKALAPAKGRAHGDGEDVAVSEHSPPPSDMGPEIPARREQAMGLDHAAGYIGVFEAGADGTRTFRATP